MEEDKYLTSVPPEPPQVDDLTGISCLPVFQLLDELYLNGKMTSTQAAKLKSKYSKLKDILEASRNNEARVLNCIRRYNNKIEQNIAQLDKYEDFPNVVNTESFQLRKQLLSFQNKTQIINESVYELEYKMKSLEEEKKILLREVERSPKPHELERMIKDLKKECENTETEILDKRNEIVAINEIISNQKNINAEMTKEVQKTTNQKENLIINIVDLKTDIGIVTKDVEKLKREISNKNDLAEASTDQLNQSIEEYKFLKNKLNDIDEERTNLETAIERQKAILETHHLSFNSAQKKIEYIEQEIEEQKDSEQELKHRIKEITDNIHRITNKISEEEAVFIKSNKELKKTNIEVRTAKDKFENLLKLYERAKENHFEVHQNDSFFNKRKQIIEQECEYTRNLITDKNYVVSTEEIRLNNIINQIDVLLNVENGLKVEVVELARLATINDSEREVKAKDFLKSEHRYKQIIEENRTKQFLLEDTRKKNLQIKNNLKAFSKVYEAVESERNKCVGLIQNVTQKVLEMRDKIEIMDNELGIMRTTFSQQEKNLQKLKVKSNTNITIRDGIRTEIWKLTKAIISLDDIKLEKQTNLNKLNKEINNIETQLVEIRRSYEKIVRQRNEKGVTLIERNEELCIFQEKFNIQDLVLINACKNYSQLTNDINYLRILSRNEARNLEILRQKDPEKKKLEKQKEILNLQICETQKYVEKMNLAHENLDDPKRTRMIKGPPFESLTKQIQLENQLMIKEEVVLEKNMILERLEEYTNQVASTVEKSKGTALELAKTINKFKHNLTKKTRKLMATVSELAMNKAKAVTMRQEIIERELELDQCNQHLEQGLPPSNEIEVERLKAKERQSRFLKERLEKQLIDMEEQNHILPDGTYTSAVQRPNAYIPNSQEEIPVPKPFGSHAPFKPSEKSGQMRFYRKPAYKQIEI